MKVFFAAVGYELMDSFLNGTKGQHRNMLFSYWELSGSSGFKQRKINWENITNGTQQIRPSMVREETSK